MFAERGLTRTVALEVPSFLAGERSTSGWWYYFPIAFLIKTPIALLALLALGLVGSLRRWQALGATPLVVGDVPVAV